MQVSSQSTAALGPFSRPIKIAYPTPAARGGARMLPQYLKEHWTKIMIAVMGGVLSGFFAGALSSRESATLGQVVYAAGVTGNPSATRIPATQQPKAEPASSTGEPANMQEVSRLRQENQQLQALVDELQKERPSPSRHMKARHRRHTSVHT